MNGTQESGALKTPRVSVLGEAALYVIVFMSHVKEIQELIDTGLRVPRDRARNVLVFADSDVAFSGDTFIKGEEAQIRIGQLFKSGLCYFIPEDGGLKAWTKRQEELSFYHGESERLRRWSELSVAEQKAVSSRAGIQESDSVELRSEKMVAYTIQIMDAMK
jgi:hypothetical protein